MQTHPRVKKELKVLERTKLSIKLSKRRLMMTRRSESTRRGNYLTV